MVVLEGVTVLDLSKVAAGPTAGMLLGDLGADVIKIEEPEGGDESRNFPPFQENISAFYLACNRNKRGLSLNLKTAEGLKIFYDLVKNADVVLESFRTGVTEKLQIDYESLKRINPQVIYCSISGYGSKGPKAKHGGYDALAQAYGGLMSVTGLGKEYPPIRAGYSVSDITTGFSATMAIMAALINKEKTGQGDFVETSLLQTQVSMMSYYATMYNATHIIPKPIGSKHPNFAPYQAFKTIDGHIMLGISNNKLWKQLCSLPIFGHLKEKSEYSSNDLRVQNLSSLSNDIEKETKKVEKKVLIEMLESANVPCSPINNIKEVVEDEQVNENNLILDLQHPRVGNYKATNAPFHMKSGEYQFTKHPPEKGEHNEEILEGLGYDAAYISELIAKKII